jgi:hypothetical protein
LLGSDELIQEINWIVSKGFCVTLFEDARGDTFFTALLDAADCAYKTKTMNASIAK